MVKMVVFDMAGTTVNEDNVVYKTLHKAISNAGYTVSLEQVLEHGAGKEKHQAIIDILEQIKHSPSAVHETMPLFQQFGDMLKQAYQDLTVTACEGSEEVFDYLHQKKIQVVLNTGYNQKTAQTLLDKLHWTTGKQYDLLVTADDVQRGRPNPDMILLAMKKLGVPDAGTVVKIGDSIIDIEEGKAAKCYLSLGITTGAQTKEQLKTANPDYIINSLHYIKELI